MSTVDSANLEAWLEGKPPNWARVIALRAALRAIPIGIHARPESEYSLALFRTIFLVWASLDKSSLRTKRSLSTAIKAVEGISLRKDGSIYCSVAVGAAARAVSAIPVASTLSAVAALDGKLAPEHT